MQRMQEALDLAKQKLEEQQEMLEKLTALPRGFGTVVAMLEKSCVIAVQRAFAEVETPPFKVKPGDLVAVNERQQIIEVTKFQPIGPITSVRKIHKNGIVEVTHEGTETLVFQGSIDKLEP